MPPREVAFDTETKGLAWWRPDEQAFLGTWANEKAEHAAVLLEDHSRAGERAGFLEALRPADTIIAHNLKFDVHQTRETTGFDLLDLDADFHDTDLMSRILMPEGQRKDRGGHGLKNLATVFLHAGADEAEKVIAQRAKDIGLRTLKRTGAYYDVWRAYPEDMERYAVLDARYTFDLFQLFRQKLPADQRLADLYDLERKVQRVLIEAEARGTSVSPDSVAMLASHYGALKDAAAQRVQDVLGFVPEGEGSEQQLVDALLGLGVPLQKMTPTGDQLSVSQYALAPFELDFPVIADLFAFRRHAKFLGTYIGPLTDVDVVRPDFMQSEAWTGRMSCRRPNMQNLPKRTDKDQDANRRIRSVFVPRPGHSFVVADYEGIEPRLLAYYMGIQWYRDMITAGHDPYAYTASVVWGGQPADYTKSTAKRWMRDVCKVATLAITYGAGAPKCQDTINRMVDQEHRVTLPEARRIVARIKDALPGYRQLQGRIKSQITAQGYVRTLYGRKQLVAADKHYVGLNALIQGSAADMMKHGLLNVTEAVKPLGGHPLLVVHDEVVVEVPTENAERARLGVAEALISVKQIDPPLQVETHTTEVSYAHAS